MTDHITLTDTSRLAVVPDEDATCPRGDWEMLTGFVNIKDLGDSRLSDVPAVHDDPTGRIAEAHDYLKEPVESYGRHWTIPDPQLVARWARIFHDLTVEFDHEHGGYWFVDPAKFTENWPDLTGPEKAAKEAEVIAGEQDVYRQWAEGEVYGVILQRLVAWAKLSADGSTVLQGEDTVKEEWEDVDSLWGCYLDDEYTAKVVALEHFDLTDDETEACQS